MPLIRFSEFDFYSMLDADSDEARTFTTYLGYWVCLAERIQASYGDDPASSLLAELRSGKSFRSLSGQGRAANPVEVRSLLLNGWASELRLNLIGLDDPARLAVANHGAPVDAYYASSRHASAYLAHGDVPVTHRGLLNAMSSLVAGRRLLPSPWDLTCSAVTPQLVYGGLAAVPGPCSNLATSVPWDARAAMLLRTTRGREVEKKVDQMKQKGKLRRAPNGEKQRQDQSLLPTTVFDFAWRMRARSNYGDPAMFYVGALGRERTQGYAAAIRTWTAATMFLFEALIAQRSKSILSDAAIHFISRDRSNLAEQLIVPRLRTLGLLQSP